MEKLTKIIEHKEQISKPITLVDENMSAVEAIISGAFGYDIKKVKQLKKSEEDNGDKMLIFTVLNEIIESDEKQKEKQANFLSKFRGLFQFFRHMYNGHSRNLYSQTNKLTEERNKEILTDIVDKMFLSNLPHFNISEIWN
uniref:PiggyBac transposable element-derived protein domain-containing protein n=1 Tax=Ditylenchus dipsaci TaxID=166011 RepID=A0A915D585_9BILA